MRNTLAFLAAAVVVVAGVGWYLDWYKIDSTPSGGGHQEVNIDINSKKISADTQKAAKRGAEELHRAMDKGHETATTAQGTTGEAAKPLSRIVPPAVDEVTFPADGTSQR